MIQSLLLNMAKNGEMRGLTHLCSTQTEANVNISGLNWRWECRTVTLVNFINYRTSSLWISKLNVILQTFMIQLEGGDKLRAMKRLEVPAMDKTLVRHVSPVNMLLNETSGSESAGILKNANRLRLFMKSRH